jgi:hypothetical protein
VCGCALDDHLLPQLGTQIHRGRGPLSRASPTFEVGLAETVGCYWKNRGWRESIKAGEFAYTIWLRSQE